MINFELVKNTSYLGKRFLYSNTRWEESSDGFELDSPILKDDIALNLENKIIKITCGEDQYFDIEPIRGKSIQYTGSSSDNHATGELYIYKNKPKEIFINPINDLIDLGSYDKLYREYIVKIVNESQQKVEYHGIVLTLEYKNNGKVKNPNFDIDISVFHHELKNISFIPYTFDLSFAALAIYWFIDLFYIKKDFVSLIDYSSIAIVTAYIVQLIYRTIYIGNTWINFIIRPFIKKGNRKTTKQQRKRFTKKGFESRIIRAYETFKNENKNKKLTEL